jgi:alpha-amylase
VLTENNTNVDLPPFLIEKWKKEGRYEKEVASLDAFFKRTGYPRAPKYYIIKWLTDYILEFGIDGYRGDTVKHVDEDVWADFKTQCDYAFAMWKKKNPTKVLDNNAFIPLQKSIITELVLDKISISAIKKSIISPTDLTI